MGSAAELRRLCMRKAKSKVRLRKHRRRKLKAVEEPDSEDMLLETAFQQKRADRAARKLLEKGAKQCHLTGETSRGKRKCWPGLKTSSCKQVTLDTSDEGSGGLPAVTMKRRKKRMKMDETVKKSFDSDGSPSPVVKARRRKRDRVCVPGVGEYVLSDAMREEEALVAAEGSNLLKMIWKGH